MEQSTLKNVNNYLNIHIYLDTSEAVFLVVCDPDPSMNELWVTQTHRDLYIYLSRLLTAHS
jgi:hypothetical protein